MFFPSRIICQHADDITVSDSVFTFPAVVPADHIIIPAHLQNAVQNILAAVPSVQRDIIFFQPSGFLLNDKKIPALTDKRKHAVPYSGVNQPSVSGKNLLKCGLTHPMLRFCAAQ